MKRGFLLVACWALLGGAAAHADPIHFTAVLTGTAENPPNASPGVGIALVSYDASLQQLGIMATFKDLAPTSMAHIHCCVAPPGTAGVATTLPTFPDFPTGVTAGSYARVFDLTDPTTFSSAFLMASGGTPLAAELALAQGLTERSAYFNIHTTAFPAGEIRGFLTQVAGPNVVPEPASLILVGTGLLGAAGVGRWRRRQK